MLDWIFCLEIYVIISKFVYYTNLEIKKSNPITKKYLALSYGDISIQARR